MNEPKPCPVCGKKHLVEHVLDDKEITKCNVCLFSCPTGYWNVLQRLRWVMVDESLPVSSSKYAVKYLDRFGAIWLGSAFYHHDNSEWTIDGDPDADVFAWMDAMNAP